MADTFRDTTLGAVLRYVTRNRVLLYPEEKPGFQIPGVWQRVLDGEVRVLEPGEGTADSEKPIETSQTQTFHSHAADEENQIFGAAAAGTAARTSEDKLAGHPDGGHPDGDHPDGDHPDEAPYAALRRAATEHSLTPSARPVASVASVQRSRSREETLPYTQARLVAEEMHAAEQTASRPVVPRLVATRTATGAASSAVVVDWYATDDPANPQNWTTARRTCVALIIGIYTFVVYMSSAIYTSSEEGIMATFGVDATHAALGLSMFVLGYGVGPLLFSPLSEIPAIGRNPVYAVTMVLFVVFSLPTALAYGNLAGGASSGGFGGLIVLRFLQGFFGSPCLASGAATLGDMFSMLSLPYALIAWSASSFMAPALGPLLSGFAVTAKGWRWSLLEILWAAAPAAVIMLAFLPETSGPNILLRRARRLRAATGSDRFRAPSEVAAYDAAQRSGASSASARKAARRRAVAVTVDALIKPLEITFKDPAILFVQLYTALVYGTYYSFFEAFPLLYPAAYGMSLGQTGLVFLCILVACLIGAATYGAYIALVVNRRIRRTGRFPVNEDRLIPALFWSVGPTVGLFIFAWTANGAPRIPWIAPTIGITLYGAAVFNVIQCIFVYVPLSYPQYAASLFAANDFVRSAFACGAILFGRPLYINLGLGRGTTVLGGLSTIGIAGIWLLYIYGARLRALSKFAVA